ncbi:MAG: aconitate hydratase [Candidatus Omnitrophica bacterium]|nr:aconitate hydratase [Candidatus Omnitrophota bacterium]MBD3268937.1 aconitate hydratase [Candidatus Omnitrophota bacterium]
MGKNVTYKILQDYLCSGELTPGKEIGIKIGQTLTQDATGTMAYLEFEAMNISRVKTELSVSYVDHNTIQEGFENADDHKYLETVAAKYGIYFSRPGNGICHQVHLERFASPGKTLLGSDSHTPTCGGLGMLAIGAGGLDVAVAMAGFPFYLKAPEVIKVELKGRLKEWVSAKDVILKILSIISTKGNVGKVLEYSGEGLNTLSVPERATIANMGAEAGVTSSVFPCDEVSRSFLKAQDRDSQWRELKADTGAAYSQVITIDLSNLVPMVALPHSPGNVVPLSEVEGKRVDQVAIGSCTNSSLKDLTLVGKILKGKKVNPRVSLILSPGSRQVFSMISKNGILADIIDAGARIMESTCGFCIGNGQAPGSNAVSVRTNNRNFEGRCGTKTAEVYLVSPAIAALAALEGKFIDPLKDGSMPYPEVSEPDEFLIDDSMILPPSDKPDEVEVCRGPNIGKPPLNEPLPDKFEGEAAIKVGDMITTDHIMPAGRRLKYRSNIKKYSEFVFEGLDSEFSRRALKLKSSGLSSFIIAGESYGQGSSREHAAICPMYLGVKAVIAKSFERIHSANLINFGILPLTFVEKRDYENIDTADSLQIKDILKDLDSGRDLTLVNKTKGCSLRLRVALSPRQKEIVKAGGLLNYVKKQK